jgi:glycosyltransferase involved in cell wall biosynthesis
MSDLVSILIPAYNAQPWIAETIQSALDQTWAKKEILILDDGSRDATVEVARSFASKSVKVLTQENQGACAARNRLLQEAQGDYLQWLDADDVIAPDKIALQLEGAQPGCHSRILLTAAQGTFFFSCRRARFQPTALWKDLGNVDWITTKFSDNVWLNPTSWLVSRKLTELAGPWDNRLSSSGDDDGEYICRVVAASKGVHFVREARTYYRIGNLRSLNWSRSDKSLQALFLSLRLSIDHLLRLENSERTRRASRALLETWLTVFYPEKEAIVSMILALGRELGGELTVPPLKVRYYPIELIFGRTLAKRASILLPQAKLIVSRHLDRLWYQLDSWSVPYPPRRLSLPISFGVRTEASGHDCTLEPAESVGTDSQIGRRSGAV